MYLDSPNKRQLFRKLGIYAFFYIYEVGCWNCYPLTASLRDWALSVEHKYALPTYVHPSKFLRSKRAKAK